MARSRQAGSDPAGYAASVIKGLSPRMLGDRMRRSRTKQALSVRELAQRAGVSKNSVVRLEKGRGSQAGTLVKLCEALNMHVDRLASTTPKADFVALHTRKADNWHNHADMASSQLTTAAGRRKVPNLNLVNMLQSRLSDGRILPSILEVVRPTQQRSHLGEEFVYVLEGRLRLTIGTDTFSLAAGESLTFWSAEPHTYAPAPGSALPVRLLSVRVEGSPGGAKAGVSRGRAHSRRP